MRTYRMRFLWPDEIDAEDAHYEALIEQWGSDEAIDDMECSFGSIYWEMPERVPCVELVVADRPGAEEQAWHRWQQGPRPDGTVGYLIFDCQFRDCVIHLFDGRKDQLPEHLRVDAAA